AWGHGAVGGAVGAAAGGAWPGGSRVRTLALATSAAVGLTALAPSIAAAFAGIVVAGFFSIWFVALANTLVQLRADEAMRGRVMGVWTMALPGMNPVTGLAAGTVAQLAGARAGFALSGVVLAATAALGWRA